MKLTLATLIFLACTSSFANTSYNYIGTSPVDGNDCRVSFDVVEEDSLIRNLELDGALTTNRLIRKNIKLSEDGSVVTQLIGDEVIELKSNDLYPEVMKGSLNLKTKGFLGNQHKVEFTGYDLSNLRSVQIDSKAKMFHESLVQSRFECVNLIRNK